MIQCEEFDTPEQDMLFRFLDAYDHIHNDIYDDLSVGTWREVYYSTDVVATSFNGPCMSS